MRISSTHVHPTGPGRASPLGLPRDSVTLLAVGLDEAVSRTVFEAARACPFLRLEAVPGLEDARGYIDRAGQRPTLVLVEHTRLDRVLSFPPHVFLFALTGTGQIPRLDAGIDEFVARPIRAADLGARLRIAARALSGAISSLNAMLSEAATSEQSGELIFVRDDESARVHFERGRIVWVHRSKHPVSIRRLIEVAGGAADDETIRDIVEQSRRTRRHFAETIAEWRIVEQEDLRECLRLHLRSELATLAAWEGATATFVVDRKEREASLSFSAAELGLEAPARARVATVAGLRVPSRPKIEAVRLAEWLGRVRDIEHVLGCAVIELRSGAVLGSEGLSGGDLDTVWELARAYHALGEQRDELLATTKRGAFLLRAATLDAHVVYAVHFDCERMNPAMARLLVTKAGAL